MTGVMDAAYADIAEAIAEGTASGATMLHALGRAADEVGGAAGGDLRAVIDRIDLGADPDRELLAWATRRGDDDARLLVGALRMHRRVGGPLAPTMTALATTLREREELRAELESLTAQARLSARIVLWLPFGFLGFLVVTNGFPIVRTFLTPIGLATLALGLGLQALARRWIRRIIGAVG